MDQRLRTLRILLSLSLGLNMGLVGFVIGHFLLPDRPPARPAAQLKTAPPPRAPGTAAAEILLEIDRDLAEEQWTSAVLRCGQLDPTARATARARCETAAREHAAKAAFEAAHAAIIQHKHREALTELAAIPAGSVYRRRNAQVFVEARQRYTALAKSEISARVENSECEGARKLVAEVKRLLPGDTECEALARACETEPRTDAPPPLATPKGHRGSKTPKPKVIAGAREQQARDPAQAALLLKRAQEAYVSGAHGRAIALGEQALKVDPGNKQAIQIVGASACYQKNVRTAQWAHDRLPMATRSSLEAVCGRAGIVLK